MSAPDHAGVLIDYFEDKFGNGGGVFADEVTWLREAHALRAQRDALREALRAIDQAYSPQGTESFNALASAMSDRARFALAAAGEQP